MCGGLFDPRAAPPPLGMENKDALTPCCGVHYLKSAVFAALSVCFSIPTQCSADQHTAANRDGSYEVPPPPLQSDCHCHWDCHLAQKA